MRQSLAVALFIMCVKASALRCGTELIDVGSTGDDVLSKCRVSSVYVTRNNTADITKITIKEGAINCDRNFRVKQILDHVARIEF